MSTENIFEDAFAELKNVFTAKKRRAFLKDIQGQIEEDVILSDILSAPFKKNKFIAVTFDRKKNDKNFSYSYFDTLLCYIDAICGGTGIYKPANQMRALKWNGNRQGALTIIRTLSRNNYQINTRRLLILPFPTTIIGHKVDTQIHKK